MKKQLLFSSQLKIKNEKEKRNAFVTSSFSFLLFTFYFLIGMEHANAQQCLNVGYCTTVANEHQYPATTFSTTSSSWTTVSAFMNADNYTLFNVTSGNTYEWSYCEAYGGVSTGWDAQLTLSDNSSGTNLCFSDNTCGTTGNAPYISWTATFTGVAKLLTTVTSCAGNSSSPYNTLVWRMSNGAVSSTILGIDMYHGDDPVTWSQVKNAGYIFAWCKSTQGTTYTDPQFVSNMTTGVTAGEIMGAYHFCDAENNSAASEAAYFLSVAGTYIKTCELPPVLDLEDPSTGTGLTSYFTSAALTAWVQGFMSAVQTQTGITPVLYTSGSIASYLNSSVNTYPLWIANPGTTPTSPPTNIGVWTNWAFKQYSWTANVPGLASSPNSDADVFNGNMTAFNSFLGCATGIADKNFNNNFIIYPNPANDEITIENISLNNTQDEIISVYNIQGQLLLQQLMQQQKTEINVSDFASGIYIVKVKTEVGVEVKKFIKE